MKKRDKTQNERGRFAVFIHKADSMMTRRNKVILFIFTIIVSALAICDAATEYFPEFVSIILYSLAAVGFTLTCVYVVKDIKTFVMPTAQTVIKKNKITDALYKDIRLRTTVITLLGVLLNLIYAVFNGVIGITAHSAWYGSLSAYYLILCLIRFISVSYAKQAYTKEKEVDSLKARERKVYKNCGILLSVMSIAIGGAVIMLLAGQGGKKYPGLEIYAVATYTFYKLTTAIINLVKAHKERSLLMITLRNIGYVDALVSILSLQTALFAAFGQNAGNKAYLMNAITGIAVCLMMSGLGIGMIIGSKKYEKQDLRNVEESQK